MRHSARCISTGCFCARRGSRRCDGNLRLAFAGWQLWEHFSMQNAKDSFYMALRTRLTGINPERTILLRGAVRPGILVEEAEAPVSQLPNDVFVLRWLGLGADLDLDSTMAAAQCELIYQTCGTQSFGGLDRGRALSQMDEEVMAMIHPFYKPKLSYATTPPGPMLTQV